MKRGHSLSGEHRQIDKLIYAKNPTDLRGTYILKSTDRQISQDMPRIQPSEGLSHPGEHKQTDRQTGQDMQRIQLSEGHSHTGEHRQTYKLGHAKNH